ncbi:hypothetical protein ACGFIV_25225 [Sphaerisporangium sp. NPDC049003]|uniref:hypothetical protein n=1 Tax=Sphaerisporangium sp. NPDC049003 TaxID=3364517 RepID=UPI003719E1E4
MVATIAPTLDQAASQRPGLGESGQLGQFALGHRLTLLGSGDPEADGPAFVLLIGPRPVATTAATFGVGRRQDHADVVQLDDR